MDLLKLGEIFFVAWGLIDSNMHGLFAIGLQQAYQAANSKNFDAMLAWCESETNCFSCTIDKLLDIGVLLFNFGFMSLAADCFIRGIREYPSDIRAYVNLANVAREVANHDQAWDLYKKLLQMAPDHPVVRRNALISLEYNPSISEAERLEHAKAWGRWAISKAGGKLPRPKSASLVSRKTRLGYVSADFCQHPVGLFIKDILELHNREKFEVFVYSSGQAEDWVTKGIKNVCDFREVKDLSDVDLAKLIASDSIDILIDLSGHSAGSRLSAFAYRPAAVMVSWLGYFATTGLPYLDAVLLDNGHLVSNAESFFVEPIISLASGKFFYNPVPWAPIDVSPPAFERNGYITFGSFNNTAKLNKDVLKVWGRILARIPRSRLILKWRTFNDKNFKKKILKEFSELGIFHDRVEFRAASFHVDLLMEYSDLDIALDPFPFSGGLTSCEALWMGIPVITLPLTRVVSRQTFSILSIVGLEEFAATSVEDYIEIAARLANDKKKLRLLRAALREKMRSSSLMKSDDFVSGLEHELTGLYSRVMKD